MSYSPVMGPDDPTGVLNMVFRLGPQFMRTGGGVGLGQACPTAHRFAVRFSAKDKENVCRLYEEHRDMKKVAELAGCSYNSVVRHTKHLRTQEGSV
jgi:hypothetical protein